MSTFMAKKGQVPQRWLVIDAADKVVGRLATQIADILREAVRRMVPRNRLGRQQMTKLKIYAGPNHPHQAQKPEDYKAKE